MSFAFQAGRKENFTVKNFDFWYRWLLVVSWIIVFFGLAMALLNTTPIFDLMNNRVNPVFWGAGPVPEASALFIRWIYGVLGATVAGWGVFMVFIARNSFYQHERWARDAIFVGLLLWYVVDTSITLYFKVAFNAALNTTLLIMGMLPIVMTWKAFTNGQED